MPCPKSISLNQFIQTIRSGYKGYNPRQSIAFLQFPDSSANFIEFTTLHFFPSMFTAKAAEKRGTGVGWTCCTK